MDETSFIVSTSGEWPNEIYNVNLNFNLIDKNLESVVAKNSFKYFKNPINEIDSSIVEDSYIFKDSFFSTVNENDFLKKKLIFNEKTNFVFSPSGIRTIDSGNFFNYFKLQVPFKINDNQPTQNLNHSYLCYPYKLFLKPISARKINDNNFELVTSAVLVSACNFYFLSFDDEREGVHGFKSYY